MYIRILFIISFINITIIIFYLKISGYFLISEIIKIDYCIVKLDKFNKIVEYNF
jgi:hypothetical protein